MRIRRRPQALIPYPLHQAPDPSAATFQSRAAAAARKPTALAPARGGGGGGEEVGGGALSVDLGDEPSQPQTNNVVGRSENSLGRGGEQQRQRQGGAADGHESLENEDPDGCDQWALINAEEEGLANGVIQAMPLASMSPLSVKEGIKTDSPKRRRGPAVLLEGSRCSRVNGRGWRCSQPTLVGYSLFEHHLGKGRQSRANSGNCGRSAGVSKLGRTEPSGKKSVALLALAAAAADGNQPTTHLGAEFS